MMILAQGSSFEQTVTISIPLAGLTYLAGIVTKTLMARRKNHNGRAGDTFSQVECDRRHALEAQERQILEEKITAMQEITARRFGDVDRSLKQINNKQDRVLEQIDNLYERLRAGGN